MNTAPATQRTSIDEQSLILPNKRNKRESLLMKLNEFKIGNLTAKDKLVYDKLVKETGDIFISLCWSKLGVSKEQLAKLEQQDLNELAAVIYEKSRLFGLIQSGILTFIPVIGWLTLVIVLTCLPPENCHPLYKNMRYYWWYRKIKNQRSRTFEPNLSQVRE